VNKLIVPVSTLGEINHVVDAVVCEADLRPEGAKELGLGQTKVCGALSEVGQTYLFKGRIAACYQRTCDRCLGDAEVPVELDVLWAYEHGTPLEPDKDFDGESDDILTEEDQDQTDTTLFPGTEIDLAGNVWEELALSAPSKVLCGEDCQGLCPGCGSNLNETNCDCPKGDAEDMTQNKGFAGLADMFPDLKPDSSKE
jgi:uncharacterized metal-binding protein YceD (DUF177 family)